jgi:NAD(P)-dependent dehydrogenase (short-subunit alcohol dehydrogenase family)
MPHATLLAGKTALITASTSGIGLKTARIMACAGARAVCINGRTEALGVKAAADIKALAPDTDVHFVAADLTVPEEIAGLFRIAEEKLGGLDILVHTNPPLVANGFAEACRHAVPLMKTRGGGSIVALACEAVRDPVTVFARALGLEEAGNGIRVNVVTSAHADAPLSAALIQIHHQLLAPAAEKARQGERAPETMATAIAETIAPVIVFLASPLAAHISGQVVSVNRAASVG